MVSKENVLRVGNGEDLSASVGKRDGKSGTEEQMKRRFMAAKRQRSLELCLNLFSYPKSRFTSLYFINWTACVCVCGGVYFEAPGCTVLVEIEA